MRHDHLGPADCAEDVVRVPQYLDSREYCASLGKDGKGLRMGFQRFRKYSGRFVRTCYLDHSGSSLRSRSARPPDRFSLDIGSFFLVFSDLLPYIPIR